MLHVLVVGVAEVLQVELLHGLLLLSVGPLLLEAVQLLVVLLARLGALQTGERLVGLAEGIRREPLVQGQLAGVQRNTLWDRRVESDGSANITDVHLIMNEMRAKHAG